MLIIGMPTGSSWASGPGWWRSSCRRSAPTSRSRCRSSSACSDPTRDGRARCCFAAGLPADREPHHRAADQRRRRRRASRRLLRSGDVRRGPLRVSGAFVAVPVAALMLALFDLEERRRSRRAAERARLQSALETARADLRCRRPTGRGPHGSPGGGHGGHRRPRTAARDREVPAREGHGRARRGGRHTRSPGAAGGGGPGGARRPRRARRGVTRPSGPRVRATSSGRTCRAGRTSGAASRADPSAPAPPRASAARVPSPGLRAAPGGGP